MEENHAIKPLYYKLLDNSITEEEYHQLLAYFGSDIEPEYLHEMVLQELESDDAVDIYLNHRQQITHTVSNVREKLRVAVSMAPPKEKTTIRRLLPYLAAALILIVGTVSYLSLRYSATDPILAGNIAPGTNRAMLMLESGEEITLSEQQEGLLALDGMISYTDGTAIKEVNMLQQLTLTTPAAGQYQIQLPDGTKAWLNALSSISYPARFESDVRKITVTGEVYLEVSRDASKRFVVVANQQEIEVLGTHFNINSYADDGNTYTTLAEGSLKVTSKVDGSNVQLKPGEQSVLSNKKGLWVEKADIEQVLSWKEGFYIIQNQPLSLFSKQIERWYNVDIEMGSKGDLRLSAMIPRDVNLSEVIQAIELKTGIQFKIEGRRITVQE
ncbi:FecR family protein [Sphingobacterium tabacisoli]|uniref:FecR family protein n=1 Tax=Sphingobacterium tabacisoli TaxID=2044855 RepID=A0ABW5L5J3_9SPHI|nr:FecR domain-containing protein [Sphingobacterium tabacisoli]